MMVRSNFKTEDLNNYHVINFKFYVCQHKTISCSDIIINYWPVFYSPSLNCHWNQYSIIIIQVKTRSHRCSSKCNVGLLAGIIYK